MEVFFFVLSGHDGHLDVIIRLVRNCALGRMIQYAVAVRFFIRAAAYWIPRFRGYDGYAAMISWRCSPSPSMPRVTTSPTLRNCGGFMPVPTPGGVPVVTMSPGSSVMNCET